MKPTKNQPQNVVFDGRTSEAVIRKKSKYSIIGQFSAISPLTNKKRNKGPMYEDIFDLLDQVSKGAFGVFNNLKYNREEINNISRYGCTEEMSKTEKEVLSRRLGELKKIDLIRSLKKDIPRQDSSAVYHFHDPRKVFIINPIMIRCTNHEEAMYLWEHCLPKRGK